MAYQSDEKGSTIDAAVDALKGGTTGQVLTKVSDADFETDWMDPTGGGGSGEYITFVPQDATTMPNLTLFVDAADNLLKFRNADGTLLEVGTAITA